MQMLNTAVVRYDTISIPVPAGTTQTKFYFPDQPFLRNAKIHGIEYLDVINKDINGNTILHLNYFAGQGFYFTGYYDNKESIYRMPLVEMINQSLIPSAEDAATDIYKGQTLHNVNGILAVGGKVIEWTKSYVTASNIIGTIGPNDPYVFTFGIYYTLP
jgi:hypothetical protein